MKQAIIWDGDRKAMRTGGITGRMVGSGLLGVEVCTLVDTQELVCMYKGRKEHERGRGREMWTGRSGRRTRG